MRSGALYSAKCVPRFVTSRARNRWTVFENYRSGGTSENCPPIPHFAVFIMVSWRRSEKRREEDPGRRGRHFGQITGGTVAQRRARVMALWLLRPIIRTNLIISASTFRPFSRFPIKSGQVATKFSILHSEAGQMSHDVRKCLYFTHTHV